MVYLWPGHRNSVRHSCDNVGRMAVHQGDIAAVSGVSKLSDQGVMKPYWQSDAGTIYQGHALEVLQALPDESVHCCVTSPPYWGLRDYGIEPQIWDASENDHFDHSWRLPHEHVWGNKLPAAKESHTNEGFAEYNRRNYRGGGHKATEQAQNRPDNSGQFCQLCGAWRGSLGLEPTPELYIKHIVDIFREVKRVLRHDGTLFLNLGDSYMGSGGAHKEHHKNPGLSKSFERGGVPHAGLCDTSGKELEGCQDHGCLCKSLCDVCREVYRSHRFHNSDLLGSMLTASLSLPIQGNKVSQNDHSPTLDFSLLENHILNAIQNLGHFLNPSDELFRASQKSMPAESFEQLLAECSRRHDFSLCLLCSRSLTSGVQEFGYKSSAREVISGDNQGSVFDDEQQVLCNQNKDRVCECCSDSYIQPQSTIDTEWSQGLKPKDLIGIPWRVAFALQADGWYLRSDIIWAKPNPMPESCTDRPTKAHEYLFLMSKNQKYYYDNEAIKEPQQEYERLRRLREKAKGLISKYNIASEGKTGQQPQSDSGAVKNIQRRHELAEDGSRNKRSVWTIATRPFPEAHFATFSPKLVEPCILAGTSEKGCCVECGAPWERVVEKGPVNMPETTLTAWQRGPGSHDKIPKGSYSGKHSNTDPQAAGNRILKNTKAARDAGGDHDNPFPPSKTIGWQPTCRCYGTDPLPTYPKQAEDEPDEVYQLRCDPIRRERIKLCKLWEPLPTKPGTILDPFIGSCTTGIVVYRHDRKFIGIDLSETYLKDIAVPRIERETQQLKMFN